MASVKIKLGKECCEFLEKTAKSKKLSTNAVAVAILKKKVATETGQIPFPAKEHPQKKQP